MNDLGVLSQIEKYLAETFPFSANRKDNPKFLDYQEEKLNSEFFKTNWQIVFYKNPIIPLTEQIKSNINAYFEQLLPDVTTESGELIKGYNGFIGSLLDMDFLLSQFLYKTNIDENNELYLIIKEYYDFLKNQCKTRNFEIPKPFDESPITRYIRNRDNEDNEVKRPNCPKCGSKKIVSVGKNWRCKRCKREFRKNPKK